MLRDKTYGVISQLSAIDPQLPLQSPLRPTSRGFASAAAENYVAIWVEGLKTDNGRIAVPVVRHMDLSFNLLRPGEAAVGIEVEELKGRIECPHARALPRPEARAVHCRRCVIRAAERAARIEHLDGAKDREGVSITIGQCHLRIPHCAIQGAAMHVRTLGGGSGQSGHGHHRCDQ